MEDRERDSRRGKGGREMNPKKKSEPINSKELIEILAWLDATIGERKESE